MWQLVRERRDAIVKLVVKGGKKGEVDGEEEGGGCQRRATLTFPHS